MLDLVSSFSCKNVFALKKQKLCRRTNKTERRQTELKSQRRAGGAVKEVRIRRQQHSKKSNNKKENMKELNT